MRVVDSEQVAFQLNVDKMCYHLLYAMFKQFFSVVLLSVVFSLSYLFFLYFPLRKTSKQHIELWQ